MWNVRGLRVGALNSQRTGRVLQFGAFELRTDTGEMRKRGTKVRLQVRPLSLLQALLDRPGDLITRDELRGRLWSADTFVNFESTLNPAVNQLRLALGDSADRPCYVATVARSGYRFLAPVVENHVWPPEPEVCIAPPDPAPSEIQRRSRRMGRIAGIVIGLPALSVALFLAGRSPTPPPTFHQLTFRRTTIRNARFAPDEQSIIYGAQETPGTQELYLVSPFSPEARPLGFPNAALAAVSDSGELALLSGDAANNGSLMGKRIAGVDADQRLVVLPVDGGDPRVINGRFQGIVVRWTDSNRALLVQSGSVPAHLLLLELETGRTKPWKDLAPLSLSGVSTLWPAVVSQDEKTVVYSYQERLAELFVVKGWNEIAYLQ